MDAVTAQLVKRQLSLLNYQTQTIVPTLTSPTIADSSGISIVGISQDRTTLFGTNAQTPDGQIYTSTDDGVTWSSGWLTGQPATLVDAAIETDSRELIISYEGPGRVRRTTNWFARSTAGSISNHTTLTIAGSSTNTFRHDWGLSADGEVVIACEYGSNGASPSTNNARYVYMSKDDGETWATIFDLFSATAGVAGAGLFAQSGFHTHSAHFDRWSGRIYVSTGDNNDTVWYSDDAADLTIINDAATTNTSTTLTTATSNKTTFSAIHVGKPIFGPGIPAGTTIQSVTDKSTVVLSQAATATASSLTIWFGSNTWKPLHYGRGSHFQVVGILPTPNGILFGSDGEPNGVHLVRRGAGSGPQPRLESLISVSRGETTKSATILHTAQYRAKRLANAPALMAFQGGNPLGTGGNNEGCLILIHPDGIRAWNIWDDPWTTQFQSFVSIYGPTANGNIVGTLSSTRTASGFQTFRAPMPILPA